MTINTRKGMAPVCQKLHPKVLSLAIMVCTTSVHAFTIDTGHPELSLRLDNTVKYSAAYRLKERSAELSETQYDANGIVGPNNVNQDDGDNNFDKGLVSNRLDILTEVDLAYKNMGARVSAAGWYDQIYHQDTDNDTTTSNADSADEFSDDARTIMGGDVELLDAFVYGYFSFGEHMSTVRVGRHTLLWGESLFYGANGIAGGQAPLDLVKLLSVPNSQFKEVARPLGKVSATLSLSDYLSLGAYVGYEWEKTRLLPAGAYLSSSDVLAGERLNAGPTGVFENGGDMEASGSGQYGLQARLYVPEVDTDFGLYAIRYNSFSPSVIYTTLSGTPPELTASKFQWAYHEGIKAFGASFAKTVGVWSLAGEASVRLNAPLASSGVTILETIGVGTEYNNSDNPGYAVGKTGHAQVSWLASLGPSFISDEASFLGEIAWNTRMAITDNEGALNPNTDKSASAIRVVYSPTYRQLFSGIDVSPTIGGSYTWGRSSAVGPAFGVDQGGDFNVGVKAIYLSRWTGSLSYMRFHGPIGSGNDNNNDPQFKQALKDRDYLSLSVSTTF